MSARNIKLQGLDEIFSTEEMWQDDKRIAFSSAAECVCRGQVGLLCALKQFDAVEDIARMLAFLERETVKAWERMAGKN